MGVNNRNRGSFQNPYSSNYGLNYDFVKLYDADMKRYGFVLDDHINTINHMIGNTDTDMNMKAMNLDAMAIAAEYTTSQHALVCAQEGVASSDQLSKQGSAMLYHGPSESKDVLEGQAQDIRSEFYGHVRKMDHILSDKTRRILGRKYTDFCETKSKKRALPDFVGGSGSANVEFSL